MSRSKKILLVEDDPMLSRLLVGVLGVQFEVIPALTLTDARILLEAPEGFDCVLLDFNLPDGTALELLQEYRTLVSEIPFIILSGDVDFGNAQKCIHSGAWDYIVKGDLLIQNLLVKLPRALENAEFRPQFPHRIEDLTPSKFNSALDEFQRRYLTHALEIVGGNVTELANRIGLSRATLFGRINTLQIQRKKTLDQPPKDGVFL